MTPSEKQAYLVEAFLLLANKMHSTMEATLSGRMIVNPDRLRTRVALLHIGEFLESLGAPPPQVNLIQKLASALGDLDKGITDPLLVAAGNNRTDPASFWLGRVALVGAAEILCRSDPEGLALESACEEVARIAAEDIANQRRGRKDAATPSTTLKNWCNRLRRAHAKPKSKFDRGAAVLYGKMLTDLPRTSSTQQARKEAKRWIGDMRTRGLLINPGVDQ